MGYEKVVIIGRQCTGKTTIANDVHNRKGTSVYDEVVSPAQLSKLLLKEEDSIIVSSVISFSEIVQLYCPFELRIIDLTLIKQPK